MNLPDKNRQSCHFERQESSAAKHLEPTDFSRVEQLVHAADFEEAVKEAQKIIREWIDEYYKRYMTFVEDTSSIELLGNK